MTNKDTSEEESELTTNNESKVPAEQEGRDLSTLVPDEMLMGVYGELFTNLKDDRKQIEDLLSTFADMVINEGDSTTSSKEALTKLVDAKANNVDKMVKIADLMTRIKLKERDTYKPYYGSKTGSATINIIENPNGSNKKAILEALKAKKKEKDGKS